MSNDPKKVKIDMFKDADKVKSASSSQSKKEPSYLDKLLKRNGYHSWDNTPPYGYRPSDTRKAKSQNIVDVYQSRQYTGFTAGVRDRVLTYEYDKAFGL